MVALRGRLAADTAKEAAAERSKLTGSSRIFCKHDLFSYAGDIAAGF
jgi:hypothetical protein